MMERLIDADKLADEFYHMPELVYTDAIARCIEMQPTVDAVQVVRCRDCKYKDEVITIPAPDESPYDSFTFASCPCKSFNLGDDFFCGKGKRKDGESDAND